MDLEFNFGNAGRKRTKESLASDKLQKAIDRNRNKQAKRAARDNYSDELDLSQASSRSRGRLPGSRLPGSRPDFEEDSSPKPRRRSSTPRQAMGRASVVKKTVPRSATRRPATNATDARPQTTRSTSVRSSRSGISAERKSVGTADSVEFTTSVKRSVRKPPAKVSYSAVKTKSGPVRRVKEKSADLDKKSLYTVRFLWAFLGFLSLRLIFSAGGVIDYYTNRNLLLSKVHEYETTQQDNRNLIDEIKKIKIDVKYQKKLVRDHLGFIANDEYVILFPKEKS